MKNLEEKKEEVFIEDGLNWMSDVKKSKYNKYYFAKVKTKKENLPYFEMSKEIGGVIQKLTMAQPIQTITGKLNNIEFSENEFQGQIIHSVIFKMETTSPNLELIGFRISCSRNQALLNWMNSLIGFNEKIDSFEISLWKDKNSGFNKSTCRINGKKPQWFLTLEQMEEKKEKIFDKKGTLLMTKSDDLFDYMEEQLKAKLDILLPNRYKEEESNKFENFTETIDSESNYDPEWGPDEEQKMEDLFDNEPKKKGKK